MNEEIQSLIAGVAKKSHRRTVGRTLQKEMSTYLFIKELLNNFDVVAKTKEKGSPAVVRSRLQELVVNNTLAVQGRFNSQEFSCDGFIHDVGREFNVLAKPN